MTEATRRRVEEWQRFYQEIFELRCDFSRLTIPDNHRKFRWLLVADERLSTEEVYQVCKQHMGVRRQGGISSFDYAIKKDNRSEMDGTYAIWIRGRYQSDKEHGDKNLYDLISEGVPGITLRERLLLELWCHWKYGPNKILDPWGHPKWKKSRTLCSGSAGHYLRVPVVYNEYTRSVNGWTLRINLPVSPERDPLFRPREVIS